MVVTRAAGRPAYDDVLLGRHHRNRNAELGGLGEPGILGRPVVRDLARAGHEVSEGRERHVGERLEDLLVLPAGLARLLLEVTLGRAIGLEYSLDEAEQRGLLLVVGVELARQRDLVHAEAGVATGPLER